MIAKYISKLSQTKISWEHLTVVPYLYNFVI